MKTCFKKNQIVNGLVVSEDWFKTHFFKDKRNVKCLIMCKNRFEDHCLNVKKTIWGCLRTGLRIGSKVLVPNLFSRLVR